MYKAIVLKHIIKTNYSVTIDVNISKKRQYLIKKEDNRTIDEK